MELHPIPLALKPLSGTYSPPEFAISVEVKAETAFVELKGELDLSTAVQVGQALDFYRAKVARFVFDLADVSFIDAAGLKHLYEQYLIDGQSHIRASSRAVYRLLRVIDLDSFVSLDSTYTFDDSLEAETG